MPLLNGAPGRPRARLPGHLENKGARKDPTDQRSSLNLSDATKAGGGRGHKEARNDPTDHRES